MKKLLNSRHLKEKGDFGPFSVNEALMLALSCCPIWLVSYIICRNIDCPRTWSFFWPLVLIILAWTAKYQMQKKYKNPTWLTSKISFYFLQPIFSRFYPNLKKHAFLKKKKDRGPA